MWLYWEDPNVTCTVTRLQSVIHFPTTIGYSATQCPILHLTRGLKPCNLYIQTHNTCGYFIQCPSLIQGVITAPQFLPWIHTAELIRDRELFQCQSIPECYKIRFTSPCVSHHAWHHLHLKYKRMTYIHSDLVSSTSFGLPISIGSTAN